MLRNRGSRRHWPRPALDLSMPRLVGDAEQRGVGYAPVCLSDHFDAVAQIGYFVPATRMMDPAPNRPQVIQSCDAASIATG